VSGSDAEYEQFRPGEGRCIGRAAETRRRTAEAGGADCEITQWGEVHQTEAMTAA